MKLADLTCKTTRPPTPEELADLVMWLMDRMNSTDDAMLLEVQDLVADSFIAMAEESGYCRKVMTFLPPCGAAASTFFWPDGIFAILE